MDVDQSGEKKQSFINSFFNEDEIKIIKKIVRQVEPRHVVLCSFESQYARSGGLAAVTRTILPALAKINQIEKVMLITPFYPYIIDESKLAPAEINPFEVDFGRKTVKVQLFKSSSKQNNPEEYYLKAPGFFNARNRINDPYGYFPDDPERNNEAQRENALFFCRAVPLALKALGIRENIVFHLQEWQTALVALTAKEAILGGTLESAGCVLTMHNPFDSWIPLQELEKITAKKKFRENPLLLENNGLTAYQLGMQLVDAPVTTVSEHFARELTTDLLQTGHFADHLQEIMRRNPVAGINNGLFIDFPPDFSDPKKNTLPRVKKIKLGKRKALLDILADYHPKERIGRLTYQKGDLTRMPDHIPILVMSGRLDPFQKGFDILLRAVEKFAADEIKVVLTPMPTKDSDLDYFREIAGQCEGNLTVFPLRMEKGFLELQMGSTFGIMPSLYEPFGAAVEYMVNGTVNIARSTGGLVNQIQHRKCGLLYREDSQFYTLEHIKAFARANDAVQNRGTNPWVRAMVEELYTTIREAAALYQNHEDEYYRMVIEGFRQAKTFTWLKAVNRYFEIYNKIKTG